MYVDNVPQVNFIVSLIQSSPYFMIWHDIVYIAPKEIYTKTTKYTQECTKVGIAFGV